MDPPRIPESFLEHRQSFAEPCIRHWIAPNPFLSEFAVSLRPHGVQLGDFSFNNGAVNVSETCLNIAIRKLSAAVRIGLDNVTFSAANPTWAIAPELATVFDQISERIRDILGVPPFSQETTLLLHVVAGESRFEQVTLPLVNKQLIGDYEFYGVSLHGPEEALLIEKSLKYENAAFVRIQRQFPVLLTFAEIAPRLLEDEMHALHLLGINALP